MNDQHPHAGYVGDGAHSTGSFATDPLFGAYGDGGADQSGQWNLGGYDVTGTYGTAEQYGTTTGQYDATQYATTGQYDMTGQYATTTGQYEATGQYDTTGQWDTSGQWNTTGAYDTTGTYGTSTGSYETTTGQYDTTAAQYDTTAAQHGTAPAYDTTGQWDASAWTEAQHTGQYETLHAGAYAAQGAYGYESYDATGQWAAPAFATDTGAYDATAWNQAAPAEPVVPQQYTPGPEHTAEFAFEYLPETEAGTVEAHADLDDIEPAHGLAELDDHEDDDGDRHEALEDHEAHDADPADVDDQPAVEIRTDSPLAGRPVRRSSNGSRGRRRTPAKRSALLTVAVPSACVMGVAGIAAASVGGLTGAGADGAKKEDTTALAAADPASVKQVAANNALDTQLAALSADARDFGDRASRTQERIDLKARQAADKKKREEEAARKEALRPKYMLPVELHRLSARFGQSGVNWMSVHTGIDFPVQTGTPVMAATDGTVRTQINSAYGNMVIVTAPDGTETWYCHLSSAKIRYGQVKAGDVIAYSGDTGNSTGPHLHFEVRPGGGYAIDPLAWLRSHGLDPTS